MGKTVSWIEKFVLEVKRSTIVCVPDEGAEDLVIFILREPPPTLQGERLGHRAPLTAVAPVRNGTAALKRSTGTS
jgi:hypothetical protein